MLKHFRDNILFCFSQFVRIDRCDLYIECLRLFKKNHFKTLRKETKQPKYLKTFLVLTEIITDLHLALQNRDFMLASKYFLKLASINNEQSILSEIFGFSKKTIFINYALNLLLIGACTQT